jgi:hypothetical protein
MYEKQQSSLGSVNNMMLENDISVITVDDNINHTYCSKIRWDKDNFLPIGTAQLTMPYSKDIEQYWIKYSGIVVIHANLNSHPNSVIASQLKVPDTISLNLKKYVDTEVDIEDNKRTLRFKNDEYNYAFIGKISRFKQVGKTFIIYLEDIGWKFLQKVPQEFRNSYIANQSLDDAFQAICEFMGVDFAYSIEDLSEYNFAADGYSVQKDGEIIETVPTILTEWVDNPEDDEEEDDEGGLNPDNGFESETLKEVVDQQKNALRNQLSNQANKSLNAQTTNSENTNDIIDNNQESESDAQSIQDKIEQYQQEFDDKIKDLFIGNSFYDSNTSDPILNYNNITITPKVAASTDTSSMSTVEDENSSDNPESNSSSETNNGLNG